MYNIEGPETKVLSDMGLVSPWRTHMAHCIWNCMATPQIRSQAIGRVPRYEQLMGKLKNSVKDGKEWNKIIIEARQLLTERESGVQITDLACSELVAYAARILTMVNIGHLGCEPHSYRKVAWNLGSFSRYLAEHFSVTPVSQDI